MIKYILKCHNDHEFESWFSNSKEFDNLKKKNLLNCIFCYSKTIDKSIMAPMILSIKENSKKTKVINEKLQKEKNTLLQLRKFVENNFEYVGENFSTKVREVYYDKKSEKTIYGTTTKEEREELVEEGIDLISIPWIDKDN
tara:strand:- start:703 stop:1125 length:423 start_codon:yes stop_codon:yes gene_type:complete